MNERIEKLAKQAGFYVTEESDIYIPTVDQDITEVSKRFAELIVRECVEQLELVRKYRYDRIQPLENQQTIIDECQYQIKQHFEVK